MRSLRILPALLFLLLLGGCVFPSGDELLAAPKPSSNYQSLQTELEKQLAQGVSTPRRARRKPFVYSACRSGQRRRKEAMFSRRQPATSNKFTVAVTAAG
ncbi:MAG: hypothetical protein ACLSGI_09535 [Butyricicoccaceae bacterium]